MACRGRRPSALSSRRGRPGGPGQRALRALPTAQLSGAGHCTTPGPSGRACKEERHVDVLRGRRAQRQVLQRSVRTRGRVHGRAR